MCSGDLREMIVNMFTFPRLSNSERISCKFPYLVVVYGTSGILTSVLMDVWGVGTAVWCENSD